jgi:hypothetical protein
MSSSRSRFSKLLFRRELISGVVGAILALITIASAHYISFLESPVKELQVVTLANTSLTEVVKSIGEDIKGFCNEQIENVSVVQVKVENSGNQPIVKADYDEPIKLIFPLQTTVEKAEALKPPLSNTKMQVEPEQNNATLLPTLFNPGDRVTIRILLLNMPTDSQSEPFSIDGKIAGGNIRARNEIDPKKYDRQLIPNRGIKFIVASFVALVIIALIGEFWNSRNRPRNP